VVDARVQLGVAQSVVQQRRTWSKWSRVSSHMCAPLLARTHSGTTTGRPGVCTVSGAALQVNRTELKSPAMSRFRGFGL
jgi:hypothetical protein